jgi:hypothetical protein
VELTIYGASCCFKPEWLNAFCKYTAFMNLLLLFTGLTPFGSMRNPIPNPLFLMGMFFYLRLFVLRPLFQEHNHGVKQVLGVFGLWCPHDFDLSN